jgi:hypothetical protein
MVRSSLAFAAAGYLLLWNEKFQDYLTIKFDTHFSLWRIWMIYYGGIYLAVATGLYSLFCPKPIKDHGNAFDLAERECRHLVVTQRGPQYLEEVKKLEAQCTPAERALWPQDRPKDEWFDPHHLHGRPNQHEVWAALIVYAWRVHNIRHPKLRLSILVIYTVGFLLLGIPAAMTFLQVTLFGLRQLLHGST